MPRTSIAGISASTWRKNYRDSKIGDIKFFVQERISGWRKKTPDSDLTTDYLVTLFETQSGRCYYSNVPLTFNRGKETILPDSLSLDRLTPDLGYVIGNVVWCSYLTNTMKQQMSENQFYMFLWNILKNRDVL